MIPFLRKVVLEDFWLKLFSLALAVLIWITVRFIAPSEQRTFSNLPIAVVSSAEDVHSFQVSPQQVEVTVQGDARTLGNLQGRDIRVLVDLTGVGAAQEMTKRVEVFTPAGVTYLHVEP